MGKGILNSINKSRKAWECRLCFRAAGAGEETGNEAKHPGYLVMSEGPTVPPSVQPSFPG